MGDVHFPPLSKYVHVNNTRHRLGLNPRGHGVTVMHERRLKYACFIHK